MLWRLLSLFILLTLLHCSSAQSDASCLPFYNWTLNSHNQTPCDVASSLLAVCNNGPFPVNALPDASHYIGPTLQDANPCQCNTVTYSLMSACGACQGRTYLSWSVWSANCASVSISVYPKPIPSGVAVPGWAYLDVKSLARQDANLTESTAIPSPTSTKAFSTTTKLSTTSSTPISTSPSASAVDNSPDPAKVKRDNAMGGGIVGGLAGLILLCGGLYYYLQNRRRISRNGQHLPSSPTDPENASWHAGQGPYMTQVRENRSESRSGAPSNTSLPAAHTTNDVNSSLASADSVQITHK
ncbi:hypothetical protein JR316_0003191 [Psilocybe cubensis]|uniref:Uncharacterized protein n=2 Tax=Psilocybe cubensis TaxID=181762 RepID=A0ACB8H6U4_PSICU|nr:hypothetical protein JR316_0003191 [Psilocybe cubensis]KAH9483715.1 hypothetical protein JR316_0003191 [Psilocybe cubensis]